MKRIESSVKHIPYSQEQVYTKVSDLSNLRSLVDRIPEDQKKNINLENLFWIQIVSTGESGCKIKLTVDADLNMFMAKMVEKPLTEAVEKLADLLSTLPY